MLINCTGTAQVSKKVGGANPWKILSSSGMAHQWLILLWDDPTIDMSIWGYPTVLIYYHGIAQVFKKCGGANPWKILGDGGLAHPCLILLWANPTIVLSIWGYPTMWINCTGTAQVSKKCGGANPWKMLSDSGIAHQWLILLWDDPTIDMSIWGYPKVLIYYHGIAQVFKKCGGANHGRY
jgi:hypothetical protein